MVCTPLTVSRSCPLKRPDRQPVRIALADELAIILVQSERTRVVTAHGDGQGLPPENRHLDFDAARFRRLGEDPDGCGRQLRQRDQPDGAFAREKIERAFVEYVDQRTDHEGLAVQHLDGRHVVHLDQRIPGVLGADDVEFPRGGDEREGRSNHPFPRGAQPVGRFGQIGFEKGLALGADDLAQINLVDIGFVGDAEIEVALLFRRPVIQERPQGQPALFLALRRLRAAFPRFPLHHRQPFL